MFVGNRLPDRETKGGRVFPGCRGTGAGVHFRLRRRRLGRQSRLPPNVRWIGHVGTGDHNRVNCSARMVLNINRESMANVGFSPPTRVFEAAGAGACLITDHWEGIETFFEPGCEILVARNAGEIVDLLRTVAARLAREIGEAMRTPRAAGAHLCAAGAAGAGNPRGDSQRPRVALVAQTANCRHAGVRKPLPMKIVIFGLSITSSWGNGHATTFRALLRALHARGHASCSSRRTWSGTRRTATCLIPISAQCVFTKTG